MRIVCSSLCNSLSVVILCNPFLAPPASHSPPPGNRWCASVSVCQFAFSGTSHKCNHVRGTLFWSSFFHPASLFRDFFILLCVSVVCSFLLLASIPLCQYTTVCLSIHLLIDIWLASSIELLKKTSVLSVSVLVLGWKCFFFS